MAGQSPGSAGEQPGGRVEERRPPLEDRRHPVIPGARPSGSQDRRGAEAVALEEGPGPAVGCGAVGIF
jgi:hypothetical protein